METDYSLTLVVFDAHLHAQLHTFGTGLGQPFQTSFELYGK